MIDRLGAQRRLAEQGLAPRRSLGQNFVVDSAVIHDIVRLARLNSADNVVEVGPGLGSLTVALAQLAARVVAIEKDAGLIPPLQLELDCAGLEVQIIRKDALSVDWEEVLASSDDWILVANLPYNVSVPIIMAAMAGAPMIKRALVMVQSEVAERLAATPGGRTIGAPTIHLGWYADAKVVGSVAPEAFHPAPNVSSALLEIVRREPPSESVTVESVMNLVNIAYRQRRKMLRSTLAALVGPSEFSSAGVEPSARPETLSLSDWVALTEQIESES